MSYRIAIEILPPDMGNAAEVAHIRRGTFSDVAGHRYQVVGEFDRLDEAEDFVGAVKKAMGGKRVTFARAPQASQPAVSRVLPYDKHVVRGDRWMISRWGTLIRECPGMTADQVQMVVDTLNDLEALGEGVARNPNRPQTVL